MVESARTDTGEAIRPVRFMNMECFVQEGSQLRIELSPEETGRVIHAILGMAGESAEMLDISKDIWERNPYDYECVRKEYGDFLWYGFMLCRVLKMNTSELPKEGRGGRQIETGKLVEMLKKWMFYGQPIKLWEMRECLVEAISADWRFEKRETIELVMHENIEKLKKRFPQRFTESDAIARVDV